MASVSDTLSRALQLHRAGDLRMAEGLYEQVLADSPRNPDAWHLLGLLAQQQGRLHQAISCLERAIECTGPQARLLYNLANALQAQGNHPAAIVHFRRALELQEGFADAHLNLGISLQAAGEFEEAVRHYRRAHALDPASLRAGFQLANLLGDRQQFAAAQAVYEQLLQTHPRDARIYSNLGNVLLSQGNISAAIESYRQALEHDSECTEAYFNLGCALSKQGDLEAAAAAYEQTAQRRPDFAEVHNRLGETFLSLGKTDEAITHYGRALKLRPDHLLWQLRIDAIGRAVYSSAVEIDAYRAALEVRLIGYQERKFQLDLGELRSSGGKPPVALAYQGRNDRRLKTLYAQIFADRFTEQPAPTNAGKPRIGFVVTEGHEGVFLRGMAGVLNHLDARRFEIGVVCSPAAVARLRAAVTNPVVEYVPLADDFVQAVSDLRRARFDLLYYWEIGTDSLNYFLPFFRPARVQCTSWGWPVTSGIPQVDYFISSRWLEPARANEHYTERLICLRHIPNYYQRPARPAATSDRQRFGLAASERVYLCAQNPRKIHPDFDALVGGILRTDLHGVVLLLEASRPYVTELLRGRLAAHLPDVVERIRFIPRLGKSDFTQLVATADVALDTVHYGGGANTTYDAFWAGVPVVTLPGEFHRGRYAAGAYQAMGIEDCVASSVEEYVRLAVYLASEPDSRQEIRQQIAARGDVLFENLAAVRELEDFFEQAIAHGRAGTWLERI